MKTFFVGLLLSGIALSASAVSNDGKIPVLAYHSTMITAGCTYETNSVIALESDLETLYRYGYTIVPLRWVAEWVAGDRDGATLPPKPVALTFDDGYEQDVINSAVCGYLPSFLTVLRRFKDKHPDLPSYSPHATTFVIASPVARKALGLRDDWWWEAQNASDGIIDVQNHSADHDANWLTEKTWDPYMNSYLRVGSIADESWSRPEMDFTRINSLSTSDVEVYRAAAFISGKTDVWPTLFAYPKGQASEYLKHDYMPNKVAQHQTYAAFSAAGTAATRASDRYFIPRFGYGDLYWLNEDDFLQKVLQEPERLRVITPRNPHMRRIEY